VGAGVGVGAGVVWDCGAVWYCGVAAGVEAWAPSWAARRALLGEVTVFTAATSSVPV
jgi:hypothetical protein